MIAFQYVTLSLFVALLIADLWQFCRRPEARNLRLCRLAAWSATGLAIAFPEATQRAAHSVGIHRGADLVLYSFVLFSLFAFFLLYSRQMRLQRHVTQLVRQHALEHACRTGRQSDYALGDGWPRHTQPPSAAENAISSPR